MLSKYYNEGRVMPQQICYVQFLSKLLSLQVAYSTRSSSSDRVPPLAAKITKVTKVLNKVILSKSELELPVLNI